jgi:hypothetical protein
MVSNSSQLSAKWLPLWLLVVDHADHQTPMDMAQLQWFVEWLTAHPDASTDPIVVAPWSRGVYRVLNGRHRFVAHLLAGRQQIAAVIVEGAHAET